MIGMAKREAHLYGDFDRILHDIEHEILEGSASASLEERSDFREGDVRCSVRVFERYSWSGGNRLSMSVTLFGDADECRISVITAGGSQAMFFKINTWGEESFLACMEPIIAKYESR